mmetsp:Transcript_9042/g.15291  ORF Transcript_9042/g.15291 Transcript_9042/m.15291 type:complete len:109 (+) Transcript_9042:233-559(+)
MRFQANDLAKNNPIPTYNGILDALTKIYKNEGFAALYRGVVLNGLSGSIANSVFFYMYQDGKKRYGYDHSDPSITQTLLITSRASFISTFISTPIWTIRTRMVLFQEN